MSAVADSGQRMRPPANGSSTPASAAAAQRMGAARASAGFQPAFRETPVAHSLSFSLSASDDFSYVSVLRNTCSENGPALNYYFCSPAQHLQHQEL